MPIVHPVIASRRLLWRFRFDWTGLFSGFESVRDGGRTACSVQRPQINNVSREKQIEGPVNRNPQFVLKPGQFH